MALAVDADSAAAARPVKGALYGVPAETSVRGYLGVSKSGRWLNPRRSKLDLSGRPAPGCAGFSTVRLGSRRRPVRITRTGRFKFGWERGSFVYRSLRGRDFVRRRDSYVFRLRGRFASSSTAKIRFRFRYGRRRAQPNCADTGPVELRADRIGPIPFRDCRACQDAQDGPEEADPEPARPSPIKYGFHQDLGYFGESSSWGPRLNATASIGSQVSRGTMLWSVVEPTNDNFSWARYDALVDDIKARNMVPVFDLGRAPFWVNGSSDPWVIPSDQTAYNNMVNEYAEFAGQVAARYAGQGVLYEIWNEPNENYFWKGSSPSIDRYARMFTAARNAMLAADPTAKVGLGGITGLGAGCCISGRDFISGLIDRGVQFDYAGIHPYVSQLDRDPNTHVAYQQNFDDILTIHKLLENRGRTGVKLWVTEWGWYGCFPDDTTKATWLQRGHERIRDEWSSFVTISAYFLDVDTPDYPCGGVFRSNFTRKPLADAFERFMSTVP